MATKKVINENIESAEVVNETKTAPKKAAAKKFEPQDAISCRSVTYGELVLEGYKTKMLYTWANAGDTAMVEYQDLQALQSRKSKFLTEPLFVIEDEDLVTQWSSMLKPIYDKLGEEDLDRIINLPLAKFKSRLKSLPDGVKESIKSMVASKIVRDEFDSITKIKAIDEILGTDLFSTIS